MVPKSCKVWFYILLYWWWGLDNEFHSSIKIEMVSMPGGGEVVVKLPDWVVEVLKVM